MLGNKKRAGMRLKRNSRCSRPRKLALACASFEAGLVEVVVLSWRGLAIALVRPAQARRLLGREIGQHRLARDGALAHRDEAVLPRRKIDVHPAAEADEPDALAGHHHV